MAKRADKAAPALAAAVNAIRLRNFASPGRRCRLPAPPGTPSPNGGHNQGPSKPRQYCRVAVRRSRWPAAADSCVLANLPFPKLPPSGPSAYIVGRRLGGLTSKCRGRLGGMRAEMRTGNAAGQAVFSWGTVPPGAAVLPCRRSPRTGTVALKPKSLARNHKPQSDGSGNKPTPPRHAQPLQHHLAEDYGAGLSP